MEKKCELCNKVFQSKRKKRGRFCSLDCRYKKLSIDLKIKNQDKYIEKTCAQCGIIFRSLACDYKKFCSNLCRSSNHSLMMKGKSNPAYIDGLRSTKEYVVVHQNFSRLQNIGKNRHDIVKVIQMLKEASSCCYCGVFFCDNSKDKKTIDHVMPISRGGLNVIENLVVCCFSCNAKKKSKCSEIFKLKSQKTA